MKGCMNYENTENINIILLIKVSLTDALNFYTFELLVKLNKGLLSFKEVLNCGVIECNEFTKSEVSIGLV
jgi:hypothetical protein